LPGSFQSPAEVISLIRTEASGVDAQWLFQFGVFPAGLEDGCYGFVESAGVSLQQAVVDAGGAVVVYIVNEQVVAFKGEYCRAGIMAAAGAVFWVV
jgi:hypothetical protein